MCGLVGMAGNLSASSKLVLKDMLDVCQVRGRHSTGVIKIGLRQDYNWVKRVGPPAMLFDSKQYDEVIDSGLASAYIGHCRHKTVGDISTKTAHPFDIEEHGICGVHNGTLRSYHNLDGYKSGKVDSEVLYEHLAANGPAETFNQIEGAWACVWWNDENSTINFIRNDQRPLYFTWSKDLKAMFWASEPWMFGAVERKIDLWEGTEGQNRFICLPTNTLWSFTVNPNAKGGGKDPVVTMKPVEKIEPKKIVATNSHTNYTNAQYWKNNSRPTTRPSNNKNQSTTPAASTSSDNKSAAGTTRDGWTLQANGMWLRDDDDKRGGEVANPFQDDRMPDFLATSATTQEKSGPSGKEANSSTTSSSKSSGPMMLSPPSSSSEKNTTSHPQTSSTSSQKTNREKLSIVSNEREKKLASTSRRLNKGVSIRTLAGIDYITNLLNSKEYSEEEFEKNTDGICCHCKEPIGSLTEVSDIFDDNAFLCTSCVQQPEIELKVVSSNKKVA